MKHTDRKGFIEYVNEHAPFIEILTTTKGTIFLSPLVALMVGMSLMMGLREISLMER